jgi:hypothetical protein
VRAALAYSAPDECEVRGSTRRDSEAAGLHTTAHCLTLIPRRRVPLAGSVGAKRIKVVLADGHRGDGHKRPNGQCVLCAVTEAVLHANSAAVRASLATIYPRRAMECAPYLSDSPLVERNGKLCDERAKGKSRQAAV